MREIKFRGRRVDNGEWICGSLINAYAPTIITLQDVEIPAIFEHINSAKSVDPATVGQFTGLRDKNGREIYEGDILLIDGVITGAEGLGAGFVFVNLKVPVVWNDELAGWTFDAENDARYAEYYSNDDPFDRRNFRNHVRALMFDGKSPVVIGNVHDTPELLAKEASQCTK